MISGLLKEEMPREKLIRFGKESLTQVELLALLLKTGTKEKNVLELSREILTSYSPYELTNMSVERFCEIKGISIAKASELVALFELSKRIHNAVEFKISFSSSEDIYNYCKPLFENKSKEELRILFLNSKHKLIKDEIISKGGINYIQIEIREILKRTLELDATAIILIHNHPSGDCTPSKEDIHFTEDLIEGCKQLKFKCLDHLIIGNDSYLSFFDDDIVTF